MEALDMANHMTEPTEDQRETLAELQKLAEAQGVKPLDEKTLRAMAGVWPEDESVDEFLAAREKWRREAQSRELP